MSATHATQSTTPQVSIHRFLTHSGVQNIVVDSASIEMNSRNGTTRRCRRR